MSTQGRLRNLNLTLILPTLVVAGVLLVVLDARGWRDVAIVAIGVVAGLVGFVRWAGGDLPWRVAVPCVVVAAAAWPLAVLFTDSPNGSYGLAIVGPLIVPRLPRFRRTAAVALAVYIAAVGALRLATVEATAQTLLSYVLIPTGVAVIVTSLAFPNKGFYDVVRELEESRRREAELAVIRERVRFAGDLHDIQGHTLHVVKLKAALAGRLLRSDPGRAEEELREIQALVGDTITQTRELAYAQRRLNLSAELENAKNLFEAAGIRVGVVRDGEPDARTSELLGQVLRETTTNILRHAQATSVRITLSAGGIAIDNDGVRDGAPPELRGLSALRQRLADDGGELTAEQRAGSFRTAAAFPAGAGR